MSKKEPVANRKVNGIAVASVLIALFGFIGIDYIGSRAEGIQDNLNGLYLVTLLALMVIDIRLITKKNATLLIYISLITIFGFLVYTLISSSIRITF